MFKQMMILCCLVASFSAQAATRYLTTGDGENLSFDQEIGTVFVSDPLIADYKVVNKKTLVLFGLSVGQARVIVYDKQGDVLASDRIHVDLGLSQVRRQIALHFPERDIRITSVGEQVAVKGKVFSEEERDKVYQLIATLLNRSKLDRYGKAQSVTLPSGTSESPQASFAKNYTYTGIYEGLEVISVKQVNVKISVAQVTERFKETVGIDWSTLGQISGSFSLNKFKSDDLTTIISAMADDNLASILAEPNLTVMSGESASFLAGGEVPVIASSGTSTSISFKDYGVKLELTANVMSEDKVKLYLAPEVSAIEQIIESVGMRVPQLSSRKTSTTIELGDGESFILGGLMSSDDIEQVKKVPLLGDIPVLGGFFKTASTTRQKTELLIVATVNLVNPVSPESIVLPRMNKTTNWERLLFPPIKHFSLPAIKVLAEGGFAE
ncbi:type II and III secretion system protein family protein [Veronia pacifica]|uniref:Pilus assembly protein CpaC n=1 Tax=Veronia pacifica TaxID=1080227 RepID=A0A1C3ES47_9GAMM|nr:pilus assembly protein N-terminal domain-containing protein [Veronia pacifica]ODA36082.1 pilus assembly protein CpaC [Veronia pacifica]